MVSRSSTLAESSPLPQGWLLHVHPQGWIYFSNPSLKIVTDQDIRLPEIDVILQEALRLNPPTDLKEFEDVEMHLHTMNELSETAGRGIMSLVINHSHCVAAYSLQHVKEVETLDLYTLTRRRRTYWNYMWNHPSHRPLPPRALPEAKDALLWYTTDNLISGKRSVVPFSNSECDHLAQVFKNLADPAYDTSPAKTVFVSWFLREVCSFRDSEHYGTYTLKQSEALRQDTKNSSSSSRAPSRPPQCLLPVLNLFIRVFFFGIPLIYLSHVRKSSEYRGRLANLQQNWEHYKERLVREYADFLLIATVLLSATVGLLSVSDIMQLAKTAAIVSALASLGSIIVGVVGIWRHQASTRAADSFTYMFNAKHNFLGYHGHAMLLSLPPVLLVWAVVAFTGSVLAYAMQDVKNPIDSADRALMWIVFSLFLLFLLLVIAALYTFSALWSFKRRTQLTWIWRPAIQVRSVASPRFFQKVATPSISNMA